MASIKVLTVPEKLKEEFKKDLLIACGKEKPRKKKLVIRKSK